MGVRARAHQELVTARTIDNGSAIMAVIIRIIGAAPGGQPTPHDGKFVVHWNPHTEYGIAELETSDDPCKARVFADVLEAWREWSTVSDVQATRPDDKPNRPLTGLSIESIRLDATTPTTPSAPG